MPQEATEKLIRAYLDAFNASDSEAMLALLCEDVIHDINQGGREIGREKFRWFNAMMREHYSETLGDIAVMVLQNVAWEGWNRCWAFGSSLGLRTPQIPQVRWLNPPGTHP